MSVILYYSNNCQHSKKLLSQLKVPPRDMHFICIDQRKTIDKKTYVILPNGTEMLLPSNVTRVPALFDVVRYTAAFDSEIYRYFEERQRQDNLAATGGNIDPYAANHMQQPPQQHSHQQPLYVQQAAPPLYAQPQIPQRSAQPTPQYTQQQQYAQLPATYQQHPPQQQQQQQQQQQPQYQRSQRPAAAPLPPPEPTPFMFDSSGFGGVTSDNFSYIGLAPEQLKAQDGNGGLSQLHNYATINNTGLITGGGDVGTDAGYKNGGKLKGGEDIIANITAMREADVANWGNKPMMRI